MSLLANILVDGLAFSMVLFLIAAGLAMTLGLMRIVNMAHGMFAMIAGMSTAALAKAGAAPLVAALLSIVLVAILAAPLERLLIRRFYQRSPMDQMLVTLGVAFIASAVASALSGPFVVNVPLPAAMTGTFEIMGRSFPAHRVVVVAMGALTMLALYVLIEKSRFGILVRASVERAGIAQSIGINTGVIYVVAFMAGAALAGIGGILGAELLPIEPTYPTRYLMVMLAVVAVGGHDTLLGSFVASLLLGTASTAMKYIYPEFSSLIFFGIMFLMLKLKPHGIFAR
jgi:branched-chain amino acid transport system permease protein